MGLIISLVLSLVAPNLSSEACNTILGLIPADIIADPAGTCTCAVGIDGILSIDLDAAASCPITVGEVSCALTVAGSGGAIDVAFGGSGDLTFGATDCDIGVGTLTFTADGTFATDAVAINGCSGTVVTGSDTVQCECDNTGCTDPFATKISCSLNNDPISGIPDECVSLAGLPAFLEENLPDQTPA